jgi:hypothetical protein
MKKIMIAALGLSLLPCSAIFAQDTSQSTMNDTSGTTTTKKKHKTKRNKNKTGDTMSSTSDTSSNPK